MYVAAKGGERAIDAAHAWLAEERRGDQGVPEIGVAQIRAQLGLAVDRVMAEGALHDPDLAALAIKQARGDLLEAAFLLRAYRATLPRFGASLPLDTEAMRCDRRISATFKDAPGGQVLGPTFDYTHRLLDFALMEEGGSRPPEAGGAGGPERAAAPPADGSTAGGSTGGGADGRAAAPAPDPAATAPASKPRVAGHLAREGVLRPEPASEAEPADLTRSPLELPAGRDARLQALARGDEGFLLGMAYSTQRGHGRNHAFVGELRSGVCEVEMDAPGIGPVVVGEVHLTEVETVNQFGGSRTEPPQFTRGYGLTVGRGERRALAVALVDRALMSEELGEAPAAPAQDQEFVLAHADGIQATGFLEHIKLPHHVDFQAELELIRRLRASAEGQAREAAE